MHQSRLASNPMSAVDSALFTFDNSFVRELHGLFEPWRAQAAPQPELLALNDGLALELGLDPADLRTAEGVDVLVGNTVVEGSTPIAQAYAGHQFGGYSPRLGDGRALLLGEIIDVHGHRRDIHLKGSGRTPFARGGDGKAAVGPMLREYIVGEAMSALRIPTTRALAVVATGEQIARDAMLPGAVLVRVASSHLRVGTFQYAASLEDPTVLPRLADYAIARHYPEAADAPNPYLAFFERVLDNQAALIARWMLVGFIHGVMNTDNMTISGESIDFGPCAFMDVFDPATVFSSIDHDGRYAYGNQPPIAQWNLARLAETLLPLFADTPEAAVEVATDLLRTFPDRYRAQWSLGMHGKLGLVEDRAEDAELFDELLATMHEQRLDYTGHFRSLASTLRAGSSSEPASTSESGSEPGSELGDRSAQWVARWSARLGQERRDHLAAADAMDAVNPVYVPRNHLVEEALAAATEGDLQPFRDLVAAVSQPFAPVPGLERYAEPAPDAFSGCYRTFCGT